MIAAAKHTQIPEPCGPELENVDPLTARVFHALGRVMHLNRLVMARLLAQQSIQHAEAFALPLLGQREGISQRELGDVLHLSPPRVSMILRSLEIGGSVVRHPDESDRRLTRVFLTPKGRRRERGQRAVLSDYVNRTIGTLSEADRLELERLLGKLADNTREMLREVPQGDDVKIR
jgi:MarR family transcriptional regulator, organic hydroperoxide resistance regulator